MLNPKNRVFIHELGHFIANTINFEQFGIYEIEKIRLTKHFVDESIDYMGETIKKVPAGLAIDLPVQNLPQKIAGLIYGCYFQSIHLNKELKLCFDYSNQDANGNKDMHQVISGLSLYQISVEKRKKLYPFMEVEYFNVLRKTDIFDFLFQLKPENYFIEISDIETHVDLVKLKDATKEFISRHTSTYLGFIEEIELILDWENIRN